MKSHILLVLTSIAVLTFVSCEQESNKQTSDKAYLAVHLTDAPAEYEAVLIDIQDVMINRSGDDEGWTSLDNIESGIYNLLDLTGGADTLIASSELDTGMVSQIRLILGNNNSVVVSGDTLALNTPSAQQSGLKIKINQRFVAGLSYGILLDFDAAKSVVKAGNSGKYNLKPVIRTIIEALDGGISGSIADSIDAVIYAIQNADSVSTYPDSTGAFLIRGLEEGNYSVAIDAVTGWNDTTIYNIPVNTGSITGLGMIELSIE